MKTIIETTEEQIIGDFITTSPYTPCVKCRKDIEGNSTKIGTFSIEGSDVEITWAFLCETCTIEVGKFLNLEKVTSFDDEDFVIPLSPHEEK